jgi:hypothetical protein
LGTNPISIFPIFDAGETFTVAKTALAFLFLRAFTIFSPALFHAFFERVFFTEFGVFGGLFRFTEFGVFGGLFRFTEFGVFAGLGLFFLAPKVVTTFLTVGVFRFAFGVVAGEGGGAGGRGLLGGGAEVGRGLLAILLTHIFFLPHGPCH